jgi:hypothetical protein
MMHITVSSAKMLAVYQQRIIESRNAAYDTELYGYGQPDIVDNGIEWLDDKNKRIEEIVEAAYEVSLGSVDQGTFRGLDTSRITGKLVDSYSTTPDNTTAFYNTMVKSTIDDMNSYRVEKDGNPVLMTPKIKRLYAPLREEDTKSGTTIGVAYSQYFSAAGIFHVGFQPYFQRTYHTADFSTTLHVEPSKKEHCKKNKNKAREPDLRVGYNNEMEEVLNPERLFTSVFPDPCANNTSTAEPPPKENKDEEKCPPIEAKWGPNFNYRHGGSMSAIQQINYRHWHNSGFENTSKFSSSTSVRDIRTYVESAASHANSQCNAIASGSGAHVIEYDVGKTIGTTLTTKKNTSRIRVIVRDGYVRVAYPI